MYLRFKPEHSPTPMQKIAAKFPTVTELRIFQIYHYINLRKFMVTIYFIRDKSRFNKSWASFMGPQVGPKRFLKKLHTFEICWKNRIFFKSLKPPGGFSYRSNFDLPPSSVHMDGISHLMKKKIGIVTYDERHRRSKSTTMGASLLGVLFWTDGRGIWVHDFLVTFTPDC